MSVIKPFLNAAGFDLVHASTVGVYNAIPGTPNALPEMSHGSSTMAIIVGNSKQLWPRFVRAYAKSESLRHCPHPLDLGYTVPALKKLFHTVLKSKLGKDTPETHLRYAYEVADDRVVAIARFAHQAGMAYLCPEAHLSIHPVYGPWVSFRAVAVVDVDGSELAAGNSPLPSPLSTAQVAVIASLMDLAIDTHSAAAASAAASSSAATTTPDGMTTKSAAFLAVRDACGPDSGDHRFCANQLLFHYDHSLEALERAASELDKSEPAGSCT